MSDYECLIANKCEELLDELKRQLVDIRNKGSAIDGDMVTLSALEERKNVMTSLKNLKNHLGDIIHNVDIELSAIKHQQDCDKRNILGAVGTYTKKQSKIKCDWERLTQLNLVPDASLTQPVQIIGNLSIDAIVVESLSNVKADGHMYYVPHINHFAIIIAGSLLHGNIGRIYLDGTTPEKIKECRFKDGCNKRNQCDYYHDPLSFAGSKDVRNYVATSWLYSRGAAGKAKTVRRFGSREHLESDLAALTDDDRDRFCDQVMHDILCNILLKKYMPADRQLSLVAINK